MCLINSTKVGIVHYNTTHNIDIVYYYTFIVKKMKKQYQETLSETSVLNHLRVGFNDNQLSLTTRNQSRQHFISIS